MSTDLTGKTALVTGSTSGIGRAIAENLASQGAHVIVVGRDTGRGAETVSAIAAAGGVAYFLRYDLSDTDKLGGLVLDSVQLEEHGHIDILVNAAGIYPFAPSTELTAKQFDDIYTLNVKAPFLLTTALVSQMIDRGEGVIVNLSTALATKGIAGASLYASSKAAVETLTKVWAAEFGPSGVRVNAVSPGPIATPGTAPFGEGLSVFHEGTPANRVGQPEEVAAAVSFLVGDDAKYIHGVILPVDGGASTL
ncbi:MULTISPECIES: SDR family NAD(P)-dependent oxidoreductase [unclassified Rathayibacter]|uniref:SDR family NAD(P)-dependent oxidoreductase n=1 Tax=unclassified Rathayibacter TaxID=2609250 RepID=UPI00188A0C87|nr:MULTISPECIES: SDR family oxidoreductase [unclassified Rathayibacter]MBF4461548.1 SDR family oxidoreductase [Rathayibacter sp. VKM Ac-2879]MBF4502959.1 SDR family oxidoreductase [Rathayibacter sp. VKM Ac-2878]